MATNYQTNWDQFNKNLVYYKKRYETALKNEDSQIFIDSAKRQNDRHLWLSLGHLSVFEYFLTNYGFSNDYIKQLIDPYSILFMLTENRQYEMLDYYIKRIGNIDMFLKLVNHSCYYDCDSIFSYENLNEIDKRINDIIVFFNVSKKKAIDMVCNTGYLLGRPLEKIREKVTRIAKSLLVEIETVKEYCVKFPMLLDKDARKLSCDIDKISKNLNIDKNKYIESIKKYPPLMVHSFTDFNRYYWKSRNLQYPFLLNLAPRGQYRINFDNELYDIIPNIESQFGVIEDARICHYRGIPFAYVVVWNKHEENYYVLSIGNDTKIIGSNNIPVYWPLGFDHEEYYQFGCVRGYYFKCKSVLDNKFDDKLYKMVCRRYKDYLPYYRNVDTQKQY